MTAWSTQDRSTPAVNATRELRRSLLVWLALMAFVVLVKLIVMTFYPGVFRSPSQQAVFAWPALALWGVLGAAGLWFTHAAGLPGAWDSRVPNSRRLLWPVLTGLAFGVVQVAFDLVTRYTQLLANFYNEPAVNIVFPANVLIYPAASVIVEVLYRLLPLPLLLWLISRVILRGRASNTVFWVLAILTSLLEPVTQNLGAGPVLGPAVLAGSLALGFAFNLGQAVLLGRYGVLASILMRVAFYVVWHMVYAH